MRRICRPLTHLKVRQERIANEILMYFRSQRKTAADVSLSDCIETGKDGTALSLLDTICSDEDLFEDLSARELYAQLYQVMDTALTPREREVILLRYGLGGRTPQTQREIAAKCGISRSYVSRIEKKALTALRQALREGADEPEVLPAAAPLSDCDSSFIK